jgi:hypothetical protein
VFANGQSRQCRRWASLLPALLLAGVAPADVLNDWVNSPFTGVFGIPDSTEGGRLLPDGASAWDVSYSVASHSIDQSGADESLYLDGETSRLELRYRYGLNERLELGFELPLVQHEGGRLDSVIDSWHRLLNLPDGKRANRDLNVLAFDYTDGTGAPINVVESSRGIGDVRVFGGWTLLASDGHELALRFGAKFPTGSAEDLLGSGGIDYNLGLAGDVDTLFGEERLNAFYRAGGVYMGEPELLADRHKNWVGHLSLGAGFKATPRIELRVQAAIRSALYDSDIHYLGRSSTTLTFGSNIKFSDHYKLSIAIGENVDVPSAPDVSFLLALRYRGE